MSQHKAVTGFPFIPISFSNRNIALSLASLEGFEPPTGRLEGGCSIHLSYRDAEAYFTRLPRPDVES